MFTAEGQGCIGYVLMGYPRVSETFIASELHRVELAGVPVRLFVLKPVEEKERGLRHPVNDAIAAEPRYLLDTSSLTAPLLDAPEVRHLHAHFAHGTTTVTWHAASIAGLPFSFTGHARDIYAPELNPHGWLRRKLLAARFAVTCTAANVAHLKAIAPEAAVHLVYHGLNADFARLVEEAEPPAPSPNGTLRVLGVGRLVAKKGFDVMVEACAELRRRDVPFEALILGQDDKHGHVVRERNEALGLGDRVALPGPMSQADLLREYRRAGWPSCSRRRWREARLQRDRAPAPRPGGGRGRRRRALHVRGRDARARPR